MSFTSHKKSRININSHATLYYLKFGDVTFGHVTVLTCRSAIVWCVLPISIKLLYLVISLVQSSHSCHPGVYFLSPLIGAQFISQMLISVHLQLVNSTLIELVIILKT